MSPPTTGPRRDAPALPLTFRPHAIRPDSEPGPAPPLPARTHALIEASRPRSPHAHRVPVAPGRDVLVTADARLFALEGGEGDALDRALAGGEAEARAYLARLGADPDPFPEATTGVGPVRALALTVVQSCNLACGYCYADGGDFGGDPKRMRWETARTALDRLLDATPPGGAVRVAFMGGEPLLARALIRRCTEHVARRAAARAIAAGFSLTTNASLLREDDAEFFARHRFAITVSMDGRADVHDALRPMRGGGPSHARIVARLGPLLERADRLTLSARMTAGRASLDLPAHVDALADLGFASVGVSPLIASADGRDELDGEGMARLLDAMLRCADDWLEATLAGRAHAFANLDTALREIHRGAARLHGCGAARDYLAVDADGGYAACHRFVREPGAAMGDLAGGVDDERRRRWLARRRVDAQPGCRECWARHLCGGGCHHEVAARGRPACDFIRGWLQHAVVAYDALLRARPDHFDT